jgi:extradiol dioxygenase family protein
VATLDRRKVELVRTAPIHFYGACLELNDWQALVRRVEADAPATMIFQDPSDNPLEMKGFANFEAAFAH